MSVLRTPFCRELGIDLPILSAGMSAAAGPALVAAVSGAGGLGVLGLAGQRPDEIRRQVAEVRAATARPFGANFIIAEDQASPEEDRAFLLAGIQAACAAGAAAVVLFWGDPAPYVGPAHRLGARVLVQVGSVDEAKAAAAAGVDAVIAQGMEAGGHVRGTASVWDLLPEVVAAVAPVPALASGGIGDGAGVARALRLGAQGVSLGTRFLASDEAWVHDGYKRRIVASGAADTVVTTLFDIGWPDAPHRTLRNRVVREWEAAGRPPPGRRPGEGTAIGRRRMATGAVRDWPRYAVGIAVPSFDGDLEDAPLWAGETCEIVRDVRPAAAIVRDLARDADAALG